jgi:hypothetical protein
MVWCSRIGSRGMAGPGGREAHGVPSFWSGRRRSASSGESAHWSRGGHVIFGTRRSAHCRTIPLGEVMSFFGCGSLQQQGDPRLSVVWRIGREVMNVRAD